MCTVTLVIIQIGFEWYQLKDNFITLLGMYGSMDLIAITNTPVKQIQGYPPSDCIAALTQMYNALQSET